MIISAQTNVRARPSHRTLLDVLVSTGGFRTNSGAAEAAFRLLAEATIALRLASRRRDPGLDVLLAALNAAAHEAHPISTGPWYRIADDGTRLERWSTERQAYEEVEAPEQLPQVPRWRF